MADINFEDIQPFVEGQGDTGKTAREKINRNFQKLKGFNDAVMDIATLQGRDEPIVFTESKEMNAFVKKIFIDKENYTGNADLSTLYLMLYFGTTSQVPYLLLKNAVSQPSFTLFLEGLDDGLKCSTTTDGIFYYVEYDELNIPDSPISGENTKLTSFAFSKSNDPRVLDGGYTQSPVLNKYIKKLWIEFPDDFTLPSGYNSLDDLKKDICIYYLSNNNIVEGVYMPKFYFRLKGVNGQFIQYDNVDGILGEINFKDSSHGNIVLHAIIDWESLKGKVYRYMYIPLNPICFDRNLYHDSSIREIEGRLIPIENYFEGGQFESFDIENFTNSFVNNYLITNVGDDIRNATVKSNTIYKHLFLDISESQIQNGDIIEAYGRNGGSSNFICLIKNNIVVEVYHTPTTGLHFYSLTVDSEIFDTILFNAKTDEPDFYVRVKRPVTIDRPPLIEDFDNLKQTVEEMGGESVASKRSINVVCFGNSFTQDSFSYLPSILKEIAPELDFTIMMAIIGGSPLAQHCANFTGVSQTVGGTTYNVKDYSCVVFTNENNVWQSSSAKTIDDILNFAGWDIITFQQLSGQANGSWDTYFKPFIYKIHEALFSKLSSSSTLNTKRVKLGWVLTHGKGSATTHKEGDQTITDYVHGEFSRTKTHWSGTKDNAQLIFNKTATEVIFPYGTAVQNLRTKTSLNKLGGGAAQSPDENMIGGFLYDGTHLQEGLPCLCAAYANLLTILKLVGLDNISIIGEKIGVNITDSWANNMAQGKNGNVIGITPDNVYLAQAAAIAAVKNPFELSFDADGESEKGVTLDDFLN